MLLGNSMLKRNSGETPTSELAFSAVIGQLAGAQQIGAGWGSAEWLLAQGSEETLGIPFPPSSDSSAFLELRRGRNNNNKMKNKPTKTQTPDSHVPISKHN